MSKLARRAGINQHTLASKMRRKSPFTKDETIISSLPLNLRENP
jgi:lambda repressor-like predicted transcriptional regulator